MTTTQKIQYNGKSVGFRVYEDGTEFMAARGRMGVRDICPLCKQTIRKETCGSIALIVSNQVGVPNRIIHIDCTSGLSNEDVFRAIAASYEAAKLAMKEHGDWFPGKDGD